MQNIYGIHITRPFQTLLMDSSTTYSTLLSAFKQLYDDLTTRSAADYLCVTHTAMFVSSELFKKSLPAPCLLENLEIIIKIYPEKVKQLLQ